MNPDEKSEPDSNPKTPATRDVFEPMEGGKTLVNTFDTLLKKPGSVLHELHHTESRRLLFNLGMTTVLSLTVFGLMLGFFSGGTQIWAAPMKVVLGVLAAGLITLPSLYIFSCLNGLEVNLKTVAGVFAAALCLTSLLLIGLTPVVWIFSQSTESAAFMGFLVLVFWMIALMFGLGLVFQAARMLGVKRRFHLATWTLIFTLVTFQMSTTLRPILGESETLFAQEKKFFLKHWIDNLNGDAGEREDREWK